MGDYDYAYDQFCQEFGSIMSNGSYDVDRPTYTDAATGSISISTAISMRCDPQHGPYQEPLIPHVEYYSVFCPRTILPGDIITPNPDKPGVPRLTVQNVDRKKEAIAFRTDRLGVLSSSGHAGDALFSNVLFDFAGITEGSIQLSDVSEASAPVPMARAVLWYRPGIVPGNYLIDSFTNNAYVIRNVQYVGMTMILDLLMVVNQAQPVSN